MKNFDNDRQNRFLTEAERMFTIGDETFCLRQSVRPEVLTEFDAIDSDTSVVDVLRAIDNTVLLMVEPHNDAYARWTALRNRENDPVTLDDLNALVQWMIEAQTGRPTGRPGDSSPGPNGTGTTLTASSSSTASPAGSPV